MSEVKPPVQYAAAPVSAPSAPTEQYVQETPVWMSVMRGLQVFFSLIVLGMAGAVIHDVLIEELAYSVACVVFTWIIVGYALITEKVSGARGAYNIWAVLALDFLMAILWLASCGAVAAKRARFVYDVNVGNCRDTGAAVGSKYCDVFKRTIEKRAQVLTQSGLGLTSGVAGVSAIIWILFMVTLVYHGHTYRLWYQANKKPSDAELNAQQGTPMLPTPAPAAPAAPVYNNQQQYQPQTQYAQQYNAQQPQPQQQQQPYGAQPVNTYPNAHEVHGTQPQQVPFHPSPVSTPGPQQQFQAQYQVPQPTGTPQPYGYPDPNQGQYQAPQQQQQPYNPQGTPAPGHPYYPPQ